MSYDRDHKHILWMLLCFMPGELLLSFFKGTCKATVPGSGSVSSSPDIWLLGWLFFARCRHWCSLWIRMSPLFFIALLLTYLGLEAKMYNFLFLKKEPYWEIIHIPYNSSLWSVQRIHRLVQLSPQFWVMFMIPRETLYPLAITPQFPRPPIPQP